MENVLTQLVNFAFLQSVFLLLIYLFSSKVRKSVNPYLIVLVVVMMVGLLGRIWIFSFDGRPRLYSLSEYAIFLFGATVYLFTKSTLFGRNVFKRADLVHYIPGILYIIVVSVYYVFAPAELIKSRVESGQLFIVVSIFVSTGLVVNTTYWALAVRLFISFRKQLSNEVSFSVRHSFLRNFLIVVGVCLLIWLVIFIIGVTGESWLERSVRPFIWMALCLLMLFISYYSIKEPEFLKVSGKLPSTKYAQSKLSNSELEKLKQRLDQLMEEKKPYLNRNLMKADLAEMLGVNNPEVARLLNEKIGMNFFEYVNYFRIREFIELAKMDRAKNLTFFGIAQEAGFNSKTTFNKSFKKIMGTSPSEYFSQELS